MGDGWKPCKRVACRGDVLCCRTEHQGALQLRRQMCGRRLILFETARDFAIGDLVTVGPCRGQLPAEMLGHFDCLSVESSGAVEEGGAYEVQDLAVWCAMFRLLALRRRLFRTRILRLEAAREGARSSRDKAIVVRRSRSGEQTYGRRSQLQTSATVPMCAGRFSGAGRGVPGARFGRRQATLREVWEV